MSNGIFKPPFPSNEPIMSYLSGSIEKKDLKRAITELKEGSKVDIPLIIGGKEIKTGDTVEIRSPHDNSLVLGTYHKGNEESVLQAIQATSEAKDKWANFPWQERVGVFLKAAELLSGSWRAKLNAATMLGQSKNAFQAEIDSACELIDFWRFNAYYLSEIFNEQPGSAKGIWNKLEYRPLEGFVFAVTPFNFTAIAGNLPTAPAMMGNTVVWKPASTSVYSGYFLMKLLEEAGLPEGVINFIPGSGPVIGNAVLSHPDLGGVHFTGSTRVFQDMWKSIGNNIGKYNSYPRIVGETGGKDFLIAHSDCDQDALVAACIRGAFEYQGQKCSALSRAYIPSSIWSDFWEKMQESLKQIKVGDVEDFQTFMGAVIDRGSFNKIKDYISFAKEAKDADVVFGGDCDDSKGYFVSPTIIMTINPQFKTMEEEIFGPVLTFYIYQDDKLDETLEIVDKTGIYALTGAIFAKNRYYIDRMTRALVNSAGNFYVNDKPTGAVVGQQPFGGARGSGTNDKAGSKLNLLRWVSARTIKETYEPPKDFRYPYMNES